MLIPYFLRFSHENVYLVTFGRFLCGLHRASKRTGKTSRYADPTSSATAPLNLTARNLYFLIPFPREVFDTGSNPPKAFL